MVAVVGIMRTTKTKGKSSSRCFSLQLCIGVDISNIFRISVNTIYTTDAVDADEVRDTCDRFEMALRLMKTLRI